MPEFYALVTHPKIEGSSSSPEEVQRLIAADIKWHAKLVKTAALVPQ
jgi:hypothetical protein